MRGNSKTAHTPPCSNVGKRSAQARTHRKHRREFARHCLGNSAGGDCGRRRQGSKPDGRDSARGAGRSP
ncbi:hypothetical protein EI541_15780 [Xanthomonas citri pv. eucalyptorum]|nr:hypothetical protein EI541_15780 [Xanthomonas axonopodis pv. eucalyptorum]